MIRQVWLVCCSIVALTAPLSACVPTTAPSIEFGAAAPSGAAITAELPATTRNWPDACTLLSDAEITAILPQATHLTRTPQTVQLVDESVRDVAQGGCLFSFALPDLPASTGNAKISLTLSSIGEATDVAAYYADRKRFSADPVAPQWGAVECTYGKILESSVSCHHGNFAFAVSGDSTAAGLDGPAHFQIWRDRVTAEVVRTLVARMH